jgi:hypothetical protein
LAERADLSVTVEIRLTQNPSRLPKSSGSGRAEGLDATVEKSTGVVVALGTVFGKAARRAAILHDG